MTTDHLPFLLGSYALAALVFALEPLLAWRRLGAARRALQEQDAEDAP